MVNFWESAEALLQLQEEEFRQEIALGSRTNIATQSSVTTVATEKTIQVDDHSNASVDEPKIPSLPASPKRPLEHVEENNTLDKPITRATLFSGMTILLLLHSPKQTNILKKHICDCGGTVVQGISIHVTHIVTDNTGEQLLKKLGISSTDVLVVAPEWVSETLHQSKRVETIPYRIYVKSSNPAKRQKLEDVKPLTTTTKDAAINQGSIETSSKLVASSRTQTSHSDSDYESENEGDPDLIRRLEETKRKPIVGKFACNSPPTSPIKCLNDDIVAQLDVLAKVYMSQGDRWRGLSYNKAINAIKRCPHRITSAEQAREIPGVGQRIAKKIGELIESGSIGKVEAFRNNKEVQTLQLLQGIYGVGPKVAQDLYRKGYHTLEQLASEQSPLTRTMRIGLRYYEDFKQRIPREEVSRFESAVHETLEKLRPGIITVCAGSYRRGNADCGDIDILISHKKTEAHFGLLKELLKSLHDQNILTDDLVIVDDQHQQKYSGVGQLANGLHRRIDFLVVPYNELPFALLHFTGNDHLNRSMRALCHQKNMHLSEKGLWMNVVRVNKEIVNQGVRVPNINEEKDIFKALGLQYLEPYERNV